MFFGLMPLIKFSILIINALAILSEDRFLARIGWAGSAAYAAGPTSPDPHHSFGMQMHPQQDNQSIKFKLINLISSTRTLMRIPLIGINTLLIIYEMLFG